MPWLWRACQALFVGPKSKGSGWGSCAIMVEDMRSSHTPSSPSQTPGAVWCFLFAHLGACPQCKTGSGQKLTLDAKDTAGSGPGSLFQRLDEGCPKCSSTNMRRIWVSISGLIITVWAKDSLFVDLEPLGCEVGSQDVVKAEVALCWVFWALTSTPQCH